MESFWQKLYRFRSNLSNRQKEAISIVGALILTAIIVFIWWKAETFNFTTANVLGPVEIIINQIKSLF